MGWLVYELCGGLFYCPGAPNAQPEVLLVLKHLRRRGHGLLEEPGIKFGPLGHCLFLFFHLNVRKVP